MCTLRALVGVLAAAGGLLGPARADGAQIPTRSFNPIARDGKAWVFDLRPLARAQVRSATSKYVTKRTK